jgi:hypothetical protein
VMAGNDTEGFPVHPGDRIGANVTYNGRRSDGTLEFDAYVTDWDPRQRGQQSDAHIQMFTDPGVSVSDAAWQGGCLVERDDDGTNDFGQPFGGLAKFGAPICFQQFPILVPQLRGVESRPPRLLVPTPWGSPASTVSAP